MEKKNVSALLLTNVASSDRAYFFGFFNSDYNFIFRYLRGEEFFLAFYF